ncbi:general secretion pathway protein GspB [Azotobacter vinelandii]|uniref:general secretion pathway protein GspB n=1 Tax=Azotobacter vinelandii TaxID=354 RepID=UPI0009234666|nr:general secretion pathway protein GspB [Azotobacter vinelandii]SFX60787.1 general secretion pathway protein B [Azotobacter vinelandii]
MSYILEALKRSERARRQGEAPLLDSPPPLLAAPREGAGRRLPAYLPPALGLLTLIGAVLGWWRPWQDEPALRAAPSAAAAPRSPASPLAGPGGAAQASPVVAPAPPGPAAAVPPLLVVAEPLIRPDPPEAPASPAPSPRLAAPAPRPASGAPPAPPAPPERVLGFHELPDELRRSLPPLSLAGFSYADDAHLRMAVINDRILRQGDQAGPGVVLERIAGDGVVLNYRGYRFRPR